MPTELVIHAVNRGGMVVTAGDGRHTVTMDYPTPGAGSEELAGLTPLRMLLAGLAACSGNSLAVLLRKMRRPVAVEKALAISEEQVCPVWAMLRGGTPIATSYRIVDG